MQIFKESSSLKNLNFFLEKTSIGYFKKDIQLVDRNFC